jgi:hypothetical protein
VRVVAISLTNELAASANDLLEFRAVMIAVEHS